MTPARFVALGTALSTSPVTASETAWHPGHETTDRLPGEAGASDERGPAGGDHGRFQGDLDLSLAAGVELGIDPVHAMFKLTAHYYSMVGPYLSLRPPLSQHDDTGAPWIGSAGIDLKPVFIPRWAMDLERGPAFLDLALDSVAVSAGAFVVMGDYRAHERPSGFEAGLGAGLPLFATAEGPWFEARYLLAWRHAGGPDGSAWLSLSWHFMLDTPLSSQTGAL
jgi:hypothetical protein